MKGLASFPICWWDTALVVDRISEKYSASQVPLPYRQCVQSPYIMIFQFLNSPLKICLEMTNLNMYQFLLLKPVLPAILGLITSQCWLFFYSAIRLAPITLMVIEWILMSILSQLNREQFLTHKLQKFQNFFFQLYMNYWLPVEMYASGVHNGPWSAMNTYIKNHRQTGHNDQPEIIFVQT